MTAPVHVHVPIRIRVDLPALRQLPGEPADALGCALDRALTASCKALAPLRGRIRINPPTLAWSGDGLGHLDEDLRDRLGRQVAELINSLAAQRLSAASTSTVPAQHPAGVRIPQARRGPGAPGRGRGDRRPTRANRPAPATLADPATVQQQVLSDVPGERSTGMLALWPALRAGDEAAFRVALLGVRPDNAVPTTTALTMLRGLAADKPSRFIELLRAVTADRHSVRLYRGSDDVFVDSVLRDAAETTLAAAAVRVALATPHVAGLIREWQKELPGLARLAGLLQALGERWAALGAALGAASEPTDAGQLAALSRRQAGDTRLVGVLVALRADPRLRSLVEALTADIASNVGWLADLEASLAGVDGSLRLYRQLFGASADIQEEVAALREVRHGLLALVVAHPLPTRALLGDLRLRAASLTADWQQRAADRRLERLRQSLAAADKQNSHIGVVDVYYERLMQPGDPADVREAMHWRLVETRQELADVRRKLESAGAELSALLPVESELGRVIIRLEVLANWMYTLLLEKNLHYPHDLGDSSDKQRWYGTLARLRESLAQAYGQPEKADLDTLRKHWAWQLDDLYQDMKRVGRRELIVSIVVNVVTFAVTVYVGGVLAGGSLSPVEITLVEATILTAGSTIGQLAIGRSLDPGDIIGNFVDNLLLVGAMKVAGALITQGARFVIGEGRLIAEFVLVSGANTILSTAIAMYPVVEQRVRTGEWPESWWTVLVSNLITSAVLTALGTPGLRRRLVLTGLQREYEALAATGQDSLAEIVKVGRQGHLSQAEWAALQRRAVDTSRRMAAILDRLSTIVRPADLAGSGMAPEDFTAHAERLRDFSDFLLKIEYTGGASSPAEVVTSLVPTGPSTLTYDPRSANVSGLVRQLSERGYDARLLGGGAVRLALPAAPGRTWLLLPAGPASAVRGALPAGPVQLALPSGGSVSDAEAALQVAMHPAALEPARRLLSDQRWIGLLYAAELAPQRVYEAIRAYTPTQARETIYALRDALRSAGAIPESVQAGQESVGLLQRLRVTQLSTDPARPLTDVIPVSGRGAARALLLTADGRALIAVSGRDLGSVLFAIVAIPQVFEGALQHMETSLRAVQVPDEDVAAARHAVLALRRIYTESMTDPAVLLSDAAGGQADALGITANAGYSDAGKAALAVVGREPLLARRAVLAETEQGLARALDALLAAPGAQGISPLEAGELRTMLTALNRVARTEGARYAVAREAGTRQFDLEDRHALEETARQVIDRLRGARQVMAQVWLLSHGEQSVEASELARAVNRDSRLTALSADAGGRQMLRDLWIRFRAPRPRPLRSRDFGSYVRILGRHHRGLFGEYRVATSAGDRFILVKVPDALVTVSGTDLVAIDKSNGDILSVDVKNLAADVVDDVSALIRNFPRNLERDVGLLRSLLQYVEPHLQDQVTDALRRMELALTEISALQSRTSARAQRGPRFQQRITAILERPDIRMRRVVASASELSADIRRIGLELRDFDLNEETDEIEGSP